MKIEHYLSLDYYNRQAEVIKEAITTAYLHGYRQGVKGSHQIMIDGVFYYDLGLPSDNLWSKPVFQHPPGCYYSHYVLKTFYEVSKLNLPTIEDFEEIINNCKFSFDEETRQKRVRILGKNGEEISVETSNYLNKPENPRSHMVIRKDVNVPNGINMFWLKSEIHENRANVAVVDFRNRKLYISSCDVNLKLPYFLIK